MKPLSPTLTVLVAAAFVVVFSAPATAQHNYTGVKGCKMCHMSPSKGAQYKAWEASRHAQAYTTLASAKAKEVASAKGIDNPQESPKCLKCHVTGYGSDSSMFEPTYSKEEGVGCESCHGPGKDYKNMAIMKDAEKAAANGLIIPNEETCKKCHNDESPFFEGFNFEEMQAKINHPNPQKAK